MAFRARRRGALSTAVVIGGALATVVLAGTALGATAVLVARTIVTPPTRRRDDVRILRVDSDAAEIDLDRTPETEVPGRYGLWFSGDQGYVRLGDPIDVRLDRVTRSIELVVSGDLDTARAGRWSGWYYLHPDDLGHPYRDVTIDTEWGPAPAWLIPAGRGGGRWAILVHGRAVRRSETLRAVDTLREAGWTCLVISYRNDGEAPWSPDRRYALGDREWADVDAALRFARDAGAREALLVGYSMGGATVLQALDRSPSADIVRGVILDSPVVDWADTLRHLVVSVSRVPDPLRRVAVGLLGRRWAERLTGLAEPVDLDRLDRVEHAADLDRPVLILHSDADRFVPSTGSRALAAARPDLVTLVIFEHAQHTRLWNAEPERWTGAVRDWLATVDGTVVQSSETIQRV